MDVHNEALDDRKADGQRRATILTLRIVFLLPGCDRCVVPGTATDDAVTGQGTDADDVGSDLGISLHRSDFGTTRHRGMRDHCGNAAAKAFADKLLAAVRPIAGIEYPGDNPYAHVSVMKRNDKVAVVELDFVGNGFDPGRLLDPALQGLACQAVADVILSRCIFQIDASARHGRTCLGWQPMPGCGGLLDPVSIAAPASRDGSHHEGSGSWPDAIGRIVGVCPPDSECSMNRRP